LIVYGVLFGGVTFFKISFIFVWSVFALFGGFTMFLGIDPLYWMIMLPVLIFSLWASASVKSAFAKYSRFTLTSGMSGAEAARFILQRNGIYDVKVEEGSGILSDHYDPGAKRVRLSRDVFHGTSVASVGVAAHETGHAIQHSTGYAPLALRSFLAPTAMIGSNLSYFIIFLGFIIGAAGLIKIGIILFSAVVGFQLITLPVEFNASSRAKRMLLDYGMVSSYEMKGISGVLNAAAMTYVAAAASSIATLLYYLLRSGLLGGRDE